MDTILKKTPIEVTDYLAGLGLTIEVLRDAILVGEAARDACTPNDPPNAPGFFGWARTVRALGESLIVEGWTRDDDGNLSTVTSPNRQIAIAVATGDEGTGKPDVTLKTKYPKGPATVKAIEKNQLSFPFLEEREKGQNTIVETWMLVRRRTPDCVYAELSLPAVIGDDGRVDGWAARIILEPIPLELTPTPERSSDQGDSIEVPVARRATS